VVLCVCGADTRDLGGKTFSVVCALPACLVDVSLLIVELLLFVDLVLFPSPFSAKRKTQNREPATSVRERRVDESTQLKPRGPEFRIQEKRKGVKRRVKSDETRYTVQDTSAEKEKEREREIHIQTTRFHGTYTHTYTNTQSCILQSPTCKPCLPPLPRPRSLSPQMPLQLKDKMPT
jgi:hypothetical protein